MKFLLTISEISLLLAIMAIIVLLTSELLYSSPGASSGLAINKKILRIAGSGLGIAFIAAVIVNVFQIL